MNVVKTVCLLQAAQEASSLPDNIVSDCKNVECNTDLCYLSSYLSTDVSVTCELRSGNSKSTMDVGHSESMVWKNRNSKTMKYSQFESQLCYPSAHTFMGIELCINAMYSRSYPFTWDVFGESWESGGGTGCWTLMCFRETTHTKWNYYLFWIYSHVLPKCAEWTINVCPRRYYTEWGWISVNRVSRSFDLKEMCR